MFLDHKIIVPYKLRKEILKLIHEGHFGITKSKHRARKLFYWPRLSQDIEDYIKKCRTCEKFKPKNSKEPLIPHKIPELPFEKVGIDIMEYAKKSYLVLIDYYSHWIEVSLLKKKTAKEICDKLIQIFITHGIPKIIISDNMPFGSYIYKKFAEDLNFEIITSSPRYPRSNGMAEKAVHITKQLLTKNLEQNKSIYASLLE